MSGLVTCAYCKNPTKRANGDGEHPIPEAIGSPIKNKEICQKCNDDANTLIDTKYIEDKFIDFIRRFAAAKNKKKKRLTYSEAALFDGEVKAHYGEGGIYFELTPDKMAELQTIFGHDEILPLKEVKFTDEEIIKKEHAKMLLGLTSKYLPDFIISKTADFLRNIIWGKQVVGEIPEHNLLIIREEISRDIQDEDLIKYIDEYGYHFFGYFTNDEGQLEIYLEIFGCFYAYIKTIEKNWDKDINKKMVINPYFKKTIIDGPWTF
ncbi:HNH endonuclease [Cytobacillus firmus]|uniref:HNH endonuclease n=2 Tax=Cytobacillus TaxID=2675230 RepID=A0A366JZB4_CYTFI|nr:MULTISPECIES: HNH endonuclease [Cytobacillus]RBP94750.1 HNH endonuclease [Cytobacillus firmus]TDX43495.1 HNH endonuclease [Cytobacillus oceanisediminis]